MKRQTVASNSKIQTAKELNHMVLQRLDESLPLETEEWKQAEQVIARLSEFAPPEILTDLVSAMASYADDQARRAYLLGQNDSRGRHNRRVA